MIVDQFPYFANGKSVRVAKQEVEVQHELSQKYEILPQGKPNMTMVPLRISLN